MKKQSPTDKLEFPKCIVAVPNSLSPFFTHDSLENNVNILQLTEIIITENTLKTIIIYLQQGKDLEKRWKNWEYQQLSNLCNKSILPLF